MNKLHIKNPFAPLMSSLRHAHNGGMNFDLMWRIVLSLTICSAIAIGIGAYFVYGWALHLDTVVPTRSREASFSADELRVVVKLYQSKEESYKKLLENRPMAPVLETEGRGESPISPTMEIAP